MKRRLWLHTSLKLGFITLRDFFVAVLSAMIILLIGKGVQVEFSVGKQQSHKNTKQNQANKNAVSGLRDCFGTFYVEFDIT